MIELRKYALNQGPQGLIYVFDEATLHADEGEAYTYVAAEMALAGQGGLVPVTDGEIPVFVWGTIEVNQVTVTCAAGPAKKGDAFEVPDAPPPPDGFEADPDDDEDAEPA